MFRDDADFTPTALQDLIDSILKVGVLSPILVRAGKKKKYELVCGERRYRAALSVATADKTKSTIPANIRELTDDQETSM
jgi:ParB family chromosome partitioning protein